MRAERGGVPPHAAAARIDLHRGPARGALVDVVAVVRRRVVVVGRVVRRPGGGQVAGPRAGVSPSSSRSVPIGELFDVGLLSRLVPIELWPAGDDARLRARYPAARTAAVRGREWPSSRVKREHPCAAARALLVRRSVDNFWFQQCTSHVADTDALSARVNELLGVPQGRKHVNIILRSGLFFARAIKEAAAAVRARIGGTYASVHVRRSDKLSACAPADCKRRDTLTRPAALRSALRRWFPEHSSVYVGSTERPDYCARPPCPPSPARSPPPFFSPAPRRLAAQSASSRRRTASTLPTTSPPSSPTTNNYALYAVETLLFGSVGSVETFAYQVSWFDDACFPAYAHRGTAAKREGAAAAAAAGAPAVEVGCRDASAVVVNGVYYGSACVPRTRSAARRTLRAAKWH